MNPYEILGVPTTASDAEIKAAYRRLVKKYHPDINKGGDVGNVIAQVNEAYDILSDPVRKAKYDQGTAYWVEPVVEDPRDVYRREYIQRKREEAQRNKERDRIKNEKRELRLRTFYRIVRLIMFPVLAFAIILIADQYLPGNKYNEVAEVGWQKGSGRGSRGRTYDTYMKTAHFALAVPPEVHIYYDYSAPSKEVLHILTTPVLGIVKTVSLNHRGVYQTFQVKETVYSKFIIPLPLLLFASALFIVLREKYSELGLSITYSALFILFMVIEAFL